MKRTIYFLSMLAILALASCDLDLYPRGSIEVTEGYKTIDDASRLRRAQYAYFRNANYGEFLSSDIQTDLIHTLTDAGEMVTWGDALAERGPFRSVWSTQYYAISQANSFLDKVDGIAVEKEEDKAQLKHYKGEVLLMRATYYYNLALYFCKDYEPSYAATELGVPLYLKYAPGEKLPRNTMKETWDQIEKDTREAISLLGSGGEAMSEWITADYAYGVLARIALNRHEWDEAVKAADQIIPRYPLGTTKDDLRNLWYNDDSKEILLKLFISINEGSQSMMGSYIGYGASTNRYFPTYIPPQWIIDLFAANDFRKELYFQKHNIWVNNVEYKDIYLYNKYPGNPIYFTNEFSNYVHAPKLFMIAEAYLIKAEALAEQGKDAEAIATLNTLRRSRGADPLAKGMNGMEAVKAERLREMLIEGTRLVDLKRWKMGFTRHDIQPNAKDAVLKLPRTNDLQIEPTDQKWVWEIPMNDLKTNNKLVPNWK